MKKIKVATDITPLANRFHLPDPKQGIYNVIEEVLTEVCKRADIEMTAVAICGNDPIADSITGSLYLEHKKPPLSCGFSSTFRVSPGLTPIYRSVFHSSLSGAIDRLPSLSPRKAVLVGLRSLLSRMRNYGLVRPDAVFNYHQFDVFHYPHTYLRPRETTGDLPRVITIYDLIPVKRPDFVTTRILESLKYALDQIDVAHDWIVCISEFTRQEFCEYTGMSPDRVFVAPLAAASHFRPCSDLQVIAAARSRYGIPEGEYFLTLAAPQPRKNLAFLIRAFFRLLDEGQSRDTYLVLAGSKEQGWMYDEIFAAAESSPKYRSRLIFTGYVTDEDLASLYSGSTAFVFPSLYEGFGLPPLEAMACGAPVITSNTTSLPEVVGDAGIMVDPQDEEALAQAMLDVMNDECLRRTLISKGLERAKEFSWQKCAAETAKVYYLAAGRG
jgi:glycosyltransferase involved in cell wall biosynthesis